MHPRVGYTYEDVWMDKRRSVQEAQPCVQDPDVSSWSLQHVCATKKAIGINEVCRKLGLQGDGARWMKVAFASRSCLSTKNGRIDSTMLGANEAAISASHACIFALVQRGRLREDFVSFDGPWLAKGRMSCDIWPRSCGTERKQKLLAFLLCWESSTYMHAMITG